MKRDQIILFTSGAGQYYHVEAIARVMRDFTSEMIDVYYNSKNNRASVTLMIKRFTEMGYIKPINFEELNIDETRNDKISHVPASSRRFIKPRFLEYAYKDPDTSSFDPVAFDKDVQNVKED